MELLNDTDILAIMEHTLNYIDTRLYNHGRRVAYLVYQMLDPTGRYSGRELRDICIAALLHDIGAYKTEEIDRMVDFETKETFDHSVYGYLFFKHYSPLGHLAEVILHHHSDCATIPRNHPCCELAQTLFIADRIDILTLSGLTTREGLLAALEAQRDILFYGDILDAAVSGGLDIPVHNDDVGKDSVIERALYAMPLTDREILSYLKMIVLFIDFRSHQTLTHTLATTSICDSIARLAGVPHEARLQLMAGSWLHDIGKTGVPIAILEKPDMLTDDEMRAVKRHVSITDAIIAGHVPEAVRSIAAHHHEKLDGSGYPHGLQADALSVPERIAVIADIFSALCGVRSYKKAFPKSEVIAILRGMAGEGLLDGHLVELAARHYDDIVRDVEDSIYPYATGMQNLDEEFSRLRGELGLSHTADA